MKEELNEKEKTIDKKDSIRKKIVFGIVFVFVILFIAIIALTLYKEEDKKKKPSNSNNNVDNHFNYDYKYVLQTTFGADYFIYLLKDDTVKVVGKIPVADTCEGTDCIEFTGEFNYEETTIAFSDKSMKKVREFIASFFEKKLTNYVDLEKLELTTEQEIIELALLLNSEDMLTFKDDLIFETKNKQLKNSTGKVIQEMSKTTIAPSKNEIVNKIGTYLNNIVETEWALLEKECSELLASGAPFEGHDSVEFSLVLEQLDAFNVSFTYSMSGTFNSLVRHEEKGFVFNSANGEIYQYPGGRKVTDKVIEKFKNSEFYKDMSEDLKVDWETALGNVIYTPGNWYLKDDKIHFLIPQEAIFNSYLKGRIIDIELENPLED